MHRVAQLLILISLFTSGLQAANIFTETIGTVTGTTTIATHESNNGFDNDGYTMNDGGVGTAGDIRNTSPSSASPTNNANIWMATVSSGSRGFGIDGIDASAYTSLLLSFKYRKESASALPTMVIEYWNGTSWVSVSFSYAQATNAATGWYTVSNISLPAAAQISGLKLRWRQTSTSVAFRLDDIILDGTAPSTYTVTYNANGGTGSQTDPSSPYTSGATVTVLNAGSMARTGYTFSGWNTASNGSGSAYSAGNTFTISANTTLYAQWSVNSYSVSYDGNGNDGGTPPTTQNGNYNTTLTVSGAGTLTKTGFTFNGWNTAANGSGTAYAAGATFTIPAGNTTLYAQWTAVCTPPADPGGSITISNNPSCGPATLSYSSGYYWQTSATGTDNSLPTSSSYTLNTTGTIYVRAYNGSCWSNNSLGSGSITINTAVSIGSGGQPANQSVTAPATATFTVSNLSGTVSGYQWQLSTDGGSNWADISGATSASYTTGATSSGMSGYQYRCIVKGTAPCGDVTSSAATLTVTITASIIAQFDFTTSPYLTYTLKDPNVTVTDMALSAGTIETNITTGTYFPNEPYVEETGGWTSTTQSGSKNFNFTIDAVSGYQIQVTSMEFNAYATSAGPSAYSYDIASGAATFTVNAPDASLVSVNQAVSGVSGQTSVPVLIQGWLNGSRSSAGGGVFRLDDVIVRGYVTPICSLPTTQASAPAFTNVGSTQLDISGNRGNGNGGVLIIARSGSAPNDPVSGNSYTGNNVYGSGSSVGSGFAVFNANPASTYSATITGLSAETRYYFNAYEWNASGTCYNLSENASNTWTLSTEPTGHSGAFSSTASNYNQVDLSFSASAGIGADGYVILRRSDGTNPTISGVVDGVAPASWTLPAGTVLVTTTTSGTSYNNTGLNGSTSYCYLIIPYNWNGTNTETYNYRTAATVPTTCATTPAPPSSSSDIMLSGMTYTSNIDYTAYQAAGPLTNTTGNVGVMGITIRDGGASSPDGDALPTILSGITFSGITGTSMIRAAALFEGNALVSNSATINTGSNTISFSGLSYSTTDNSTRDLTLRVSFLTTVTDNLQMTFSVTNANVTTASGSTSSQMSAFATVNSSTTGDRNRIEVTATKLRFVQQPTTTSVNVSMAPGVTVEAADNNNCRDLDYTTNISIHSTGTMTGDPVSVTPVSGLATFSSLVHTVDGTGFTLEASSGGFSTITSSPFNITIFTYLTGDYRSASSGSWLGTGSTSTWDRYGTPNPGWNLNVTRPATNTANRVFIEHAITATSISPDKVYIRDGGTLTIASSSTVNDSLKVEKGGTLQLNANLDIGISANSGVFEVDSGGTVKVNFAFGTPSSSIWLGKEIFHPGSDLIFNDWDCANDILIPDNTALTANTYNGYTAVFGNVIVDFGSNLGASDDWILLGSGVTQNLAHGDLIFRSNDAANGADMRIATVGTVSSGIGGNFHVENSYIGAVFINFKTSGTLTFTIKGDMLLDAATVRGLSSSIAGSSSTINIDGNMTISSSAVFDFNSTVAGTSPAPLSVINLKGDLAVTGTGGLLNNSNSSYNGILNFTGTGNGLTDSTTQTIDIASTSGNENRYTNFFVKNGSYVKLISRDFELGTNDTLTVENGGVLDFGFNGTTALLVKASGAQTGQTFRSLQGSTLKITSPDGITTTTGVGNVQTDATRRNYDQVATFHYIGKQNQVTGNGITTASTAKIIICDLIDNNTQLSFSNSTSITSTTTISPTGGKLDIRRGQVIESETAYITGSTGTLYMSQGTLYKIMKGYTLATTESGSSGGTYIPRMIGSDYPYVLLGGTIELGGNTAGNYFQTLRGTNGGRPNFKYIKFSGQNNYNFSTRTATDYKNLSSTTSIDSALLITGSAVVDCINMSGQATSFVGNGGLVMDNGRIRIRNTSGTQPELIGDNVAYSLTGGNVEFYGSSSTQQQQMRGNYKSVSPVKVSYYNVDINADASNYDTSFVGAAGNVDMVSSFLLKNALNIYSPAVFRMDESDFIDDAASPTNSFTVNTGGGLLYGNTSGITSSGATGNIRISGTRSFLTTASYGFVGNNTMVSGNGLPATVASLYVYRNSIQKLVNLTNSVSVTDSLNFYRGIIVTGANKVTMLSGSKTAIKNHDVPFTGNSGVPTYIDDRYVIGNLERNINTTGIYVFPVGDVVSGEAYNPLRFDVSSGSGMALAQFIPGDPGSCVAGPEFFTCGSEQKGYNYTDMTTEGRWRMTSSTSTTFDYDIYLHPNIKNLNTTPNVWIDTLTGTNYLIDYRSLKAPNGTTDWSSYANTGDRCVSSYYYNILGRGFSGFSDFAPAGGNINTTSQLPVELISFSGDCQEDGSVLLSWATASEQNSSHYIVEQSLNGTQFTQVASIPAAGNSNALRTYSSRVLPAAERTYYRLTMVDLDGSTEYSPTIIASCFGKLGGLGVHYSPEEGLVLQSQLTESNRYQLSLYDAAGKLVMQENKTLDRGMNRYTLDIRKKLAKGIYFFRATNGTNSYTQKLWIY